MTFFEEQLILHASAVISGVKASNMFSIPVSQAYHVREDFCTYCKILSAKGLKMRFLYCMGNKVNVFIYNEELLNDILHNRKVAGFLKDHGYPVNGCMGDMLMRLKERIIEEKGFPHEIGFFLGYPADDVFGFIYEKGRNYKMCGCWKVYNNTERAAFLFKTYENIKNLFLNMAKSGVPVAKIISAA